MVMTMDTSKNMWRRNGRLNFLPNGLVLYAPLWHPQLNVSPFSAWNIADGGVHSCTVTGATWGIQGRDFNGTTDFISIPDNAALDTLGSFSNGIWFKLDTLAVNQCLMSKETGTRQQIQLYFRTATKDIYSELWDGTNVSLAISLANSIDTVGKWYQVWGVLNKTVDLRLFINGAANGTPVTDITGSIINTAALQIGKRTVGGAIYLDGVVGEALILNRALTAAEILHNYQITKWRYS